MKPYLVVSDEKGNIFEIPELLMAGRSLDRTVLPQENELILLPYGSNMFMLPQRIAVGYDPVQNSFTKKGDYKGNSVYPVAAFIAPGYVHFYSTAFIRECGADPLSLFCYAAVGYMKGQFYTSGQRIDLDNRQDLHLFNERTITIRAKRMKRRFTHNRLVQHLVDNCVACYGCPAARNFVMERWECPVPVSPGCNAACIGCISRQPEDSGIPSSQKRISFIPTIEEIVEFTVPHLIKAPRAIISFGQGCEGEPLLYTDLLEASILQIRKNTDRGIINLNTNGSRPRAVERLFKAGLNSIRVSLNSAQERYYHAYYRPQDYTFGDVIESLLITRRYRKWSSLNYMIFPGFSDSRQEFSALEQLISRVKPNMIQTRNLNIDPDLYIEQLALKQTAEDSIGIQNWLISIQKKYPWLKFGYFNPFREEIEGT